MQLSRFVSILLVAVAATLAACEDDAVRPTLPMAAADTTFQPLAVGSAWTYTATRALRYYDMDGGEARPPQDLHATVVREITAREEIDGRSWALEEERFTIDGASDPVLAWRRYRADRTGLYRADLPTRLAPGNAAGVDSLTEARRLAYPPVVGHSWHLHDEDLSESGSIASLDTLATPGGPQAAYRVDYRLANDGPDDYRHFWYSGTGMLRSEVHAEFIAVDISTGDAIRIESTEIWGVSGILLPGGDRTQKSPGAAVRTEARPAPVRR